jgi:hypothetical protein
LAIPRLLRSLPKTVSDKRAVFDAKLTLEADLIRPLYVTCRQHIDAWIGKGGAHSGIDRSVSQLRLEHVLLRHYARVVMVMTGRKPSRSPRLEEAALSLRHLESLRKRAHAQAHLILRSIDRDLTSIPKRVENDSGDGTNHFAKSADVDLELKEQPTAGYVLRLKEGVRNAVARLRGRIGAIANVNTNGPAEEARHEYVLQNNANARIFQTWQCMLDARVRHPPRSRFDHLAPHGQTVGVQEAFEISGEMLRYPGDTSMGASLGNIVNCRCTVQYRARADNGEERELFTTPSAPTRRQHLPGRPERPGVPSSGYRFKPTTIVTLNSGTRAKIVLGNGEPALLRVEQPGLLTIRVRGDTIARARFDGGKITELTISPEHRAPTTDIEGLIRRSVEHSAGR